MKIIFMGTPDFSVGTLEALIGAGHEITLVVSQPDKPKGRGHELQPTPVKEAALRHGLTVYQPKKVRDPEVIEKLRATEADVIVVIAFGQIIPKAILEMKQYGCINVHASLLPKYRGAAPIQWAVIDGEKESGVTIMQMDEGLDTGDMLLKGSVALAADETGGSLFDKLGALGADLCVEALDKLEKGELKPEKQGESPTEYARMLTKEMGCLNWQESAEKLERLIRGLNPWPSAYTKLGDKTLKIWSAQVCERTDENAACGEIIDVTKDAVCVACGEGALKITELQLQGKKRMDTGAFLRGCRLETGTKLG
ncbi:methionyl-tRNA formyltransferase [Candidatus Merdisoma sp. HCP28S3_D10]|uniref:methionyl-tRNA formyltransferase n=1 Tax=unclassified Candidatus Merdisoma TaxID=3099611 RepID=UPI003F88610E